MVRGHHATAGEAFFLKEARGIPAGRASITREGKNFFAPTGNRTRGKRMATIYFTTKPSALLICSVGEFLLFEPIFCLMPLFQFLTGLFHSLQGCKGLYCHVVLPRSQHTPEGHHTEASTGCWSSEFKLLYRRNSHQHPPRLASRLESQIASTVV